MMTLAFYKGPANGWLHQMTHKLICWVTESDYSHCELVIGGICYSASARDGGVRGKVIDLQSGRWDLVEVNRDETAALGWFLRHHHEKYDWAGVFRFILPFVPQAKRQWFCSEACAAMLGLSDPHKVAPGDLFRHFSRQ
jgi:hypothetical protein